MVDLWMESSQITHQILSVTHPAFVLEFTKAFIISPIDNLLLSRRVASANLHRTSISELRIVCSCTYYNCFCFLTTQSVKYYSDYL